MKWLHSFLFLFLMIFLAQAQFSNEQVQEKQFENSALYFQRFYLNTFGLINFTAVAPGFFEDSFTRLKLNPAFGLQDTSRQSTFYVDFRSERETELPRQFVQPVYERATVMPDYFIPPDPRWYRISRSEPEPVLSAGLRSWLASKLHLTLAYQLIYKEEPFYRQPVYFYAYNPYYDAFNQRMLPGEVGIPSVIRNKQNDQALTRAHLLAGYLSYRLNSVFDLGFGADFVQHKRQADYLTLYNGEYGQDAFSSRENTRNLNYHHADYFTGINWHASSAWQFGWQAGWLKGNVKQHEVFDDSSHYSTEQGFNFSHQMETSDYRHQGDRYYSTLTFQYSADQQNKLVGFLNYNYLKNDIANRASTCNLARAEYNFRNGLEYNLHQNHSTLTDRRSSCGNLKEHFWEAMITVFMKQSSKTRMHFGLYYSYLDGRKKISEPLFYEAYSSYYNEGDDQNGHFVYQNTLLRREDKTLYWTYRYNRQSIQMPIYWWYKINNNLAFFTIINKLWNAWETDENTDAWYKERYDLHDGQEELKQNFIERYDDGAGRHYTKDMTDLALGFEVFLLKDVTIRYLVNPDFLDADLTISQWWLSLSARF